MNKNSNTDNYESANNISFVIIMATYNRVKYLKRSLYSISQSSIPLNNIVIINDYSSDNTSEEIKKNYPLVNLIDLNKNVGPGEAREIGIEKASEDWAIIMDDDEELLQNGIEQISKVIKNNQNLNNFPVLFFATSSMSNLKEEYLILTPKNLLTAKGIGECKPIINLRLWKKMNFHYPRTRIGGEGLLWLELALHYGIPAFNIPIAHYHTDAPNRLTSTQVQLKNSREHARLQDMYIEFMISNHLSNQYHDLFIKKYLASATYYLLDGNKSLFRNRLKELPNQTYLFEKTFLILIGYLPMSMIFSVFKVFRFIQNIRH